MPPKWRWVLWLNPLTGIIEGYRASLLGRTPFDWPALGISALITVAILVYSAFTFRRMERTFADIV
jgi:lipopolysaccharide transport system permease protein